MYVNYSRDLLRTKQTHKGQKKRVRRPSRQGYMLVALNRIYALNPRHLSLRGGGLFS